MKLLHQGNQKLRLSYGQAFDYPAHLHNALELVLLTRGRMTALCDGVRATLEKGDLFVAFPNQVHGYENSQNTEGFVLIVPTVPYLESFRSILEHKKPSNAVLPKAKWQDASLDTLLQIALFDKEHPDWKVMQGYIMTLTGKILSLYPLRERSVGDTDGLQELLLYINEHFREPLSRGDIAGAVGYNESYVSHIFRDSLHTTLTDYITSLRLDEAKTLLRDTDHTVSNIASSLGFGSIRSFNRIFLRHTGMTPTHYRKNG